MKFIVKHNKKETKIINFDEDKQAYIVEVKGRPINNEVNIELVKFLSKYFKTNNIRIIKGSRSREKIIKLE